MAKNFGYKNSKSVDGSFTVRLNKTVTQKLKDYCAMRGINCTKYVNEAMDKQIETDKRRHLSSLSKEELLSILLNSKEEQLGFNTEGEEK